MSVWENPIDFLHYKYSISETYRFPELKYVALLYASQPHVKKIAFYSPTLLSSLLSHFFFCGSFCFTYFAAHIREERATYCTLNIAVSCCNALLHISHSRSRVCIFALASFSHERLKVEQRCLEGDRVSMCKIGQYRQRDKYVSVSTTLSPAAQFA